MGALVPSVRMITALEACCTCPMKHAIGIWSRCQKGEDIAKHVVDAMKAVEEENRSLNGVLPKTYNRLSDGTLVALLKLFNSIEMDMEGDVFGRIYEYFLAQFAMSEGRRGGEFFTPISIVRLIVEIIEPYTGRILDPACGSGWYVCAERSFHRGAPGRS